MRPHTVFVLSAAVVLAFGPAASADPALQARAEARIRAVEPALVEFRRDLHRHPELSGEERRTATKIVTRMKALGLQVRTGVGGHGVVATLKGGKPGPRVLVRADMDAVRDASPDPVEFRSTTTGVRHVCGHDVHVTVAVGVAEALAPLARELPGTVVFVFQPAEERADGAQLMLADGALRDGVPDASFAFHTAPLEVGTVGTKPGTMLPWRDLFEITLAADPSLDAAGARAALEQAADAILDSANTLSTLAPEMRFRPTTADFRFLHGAGQRPGDVPRTRVVEGHFASSSDSFTIDTERALRRAIAAQAARKVTGRLAWKARGVPGAVNDPAVEARARAALVRALGDSAVASMRSVPPAFSEDFGAFQAKSPGVMFWLGVSNAAKGTVGMPHTPGYVADEGAIAFGARAMSAVVLAELSRAR